MVYTPQVWQDFPSTATPLSAARMQHIEDGIADLGADWASYTPTLGGATLGNGSATGAFVQIGKTVAFRAQFTLGSTSTVTGNFTISLPVTASNGNFVATGTIEDSGTARLPAMCFGQTTSVLVYAIGTDTTFAYFRPFSATVPFTWTTGDFILVSGVYQAV